MLDVQPVLNKLQELSAQHGVWVTPKLIFYPSGDGAVVLHHMLHDRQIAAVDFDAGDDLLDAVERLAVKANEVLAS